MVQLAFVMAAAVPVLWYWKLYKYLNDDRKAATYLFAAFFMGLPVFVFDAEDNHQ
jgi:hypothetical protein